MKKKLKEEIDIAHEALQRSIDGFCEDFDNFNIHVCG